MFQLQEQNFMEDRVYSYGIQFRNEGWSKDYGHSKIGENRKSDWQEKPKEERVKKEVQKKREVKK